MRIVTFKEEIILSALMMFGGSAHGVEIRDKVVELSGKEIVYGTLYNSLEHLIRKGFASSRKGKPTPERGGKSKAVYSITPDGKTALLETKKLHENIWEKIPNIELGFK